MDEFQEYPPMLTFRLGLSYIHAHAELVDTRLYRFPHVIKATLQHNAWHRWVARAVAWLPAPMQRLVRWIWSHYGLPDRVILKKLRKPEHIEAFTNEQAMYRRLATAQGSLVPRYYGGHM
ncbi:hypothetical protein SCUCBS95973_007405 [Sporothrix curviconia]|uniref:Uncharacterized protein n=1 Tax=Sporothrix curviconia TaxID=1260050 RepID=A0ABP0CE99_9PEZI